MSAALEADGDEQPDLLALALSRPNDALAQARSSLAGSRPDPLAASIARQAVGIVLREYGDIDAAVDELRAARRLARRSGSLEREADVLGTLGVALIFAGRTVAGRNALDAAVRQSSGTLHHRMLFRRGAAKLILGQRSEALQDLNPAISAMRIAGDEIWEARALQERAVAHVLGGSARRGAADLRRAATLFDANGQELESAEVTVNRGVVALRLGDLPESLRCFDEAADRFERLGALEPDLSVHRCAALATAGLFADALREAESAIAALEQIHGRPTKLAELMLTAAGCALAAGEPLIALERASEARQLFSRQGRHWWRAHADLVRVRAGIDVGPATPRLLTEARNCVRTLSALSSPDHPLALLTAGRIALALDQEPVARRHLVAAAASRRRGLPLSRAAGWLAEALRAEAAGDSRRLLDACRRGLDLIDDYRSIIGSSELRAQSTAHGAELAALGQRHALRLGRPRVLLTWSERWRAVALAVPPVRPAGDTELQDELAAMRDISLRLSRASRLGPQTVSLLHEQRRLERRVRSRTMRTAGAGQSRAATNGATRFRISELLAELGDDRLLSLVDVEGRLHVLVCGGGEVREFAAGTTERASHEVRFARFALRRLAEGPMVRSSVDAYQRLLRAGETLERVLLSEAADHIGDGKVIIVPPGKLHAVPWGMLPCLHTRAVHVVPSAASWSGAARAAAGDADDTAGPVVLVRGPGLASHGAEVPQLAVDYAETGEPVVLGDGTATAAEVLRAMDGARLVHIAAHGDFRADSPLFSALRLDDGPLTVYDLERLRKGPRRLVLSSCDSGVVAPAGADEVLGLASSLIPLGTAAIIASVVPVSDNAVVPLMVDLHAELRRGRSMSEALSRARLAAAADPVADPVAAATGLSFISLGAG